MANPKKLTSISVDSSACQTTYFAGQYFNPAGAVVTAHYSNGASAVVTTYIYGPTNQLSTTDTHVTFIYVEGGISKSAQVAITVLPANTPVSLSATLSGPVVYYAGERFASRCLSLTLHYGGGGSRVAYLSECSVRVNGAATDVLALGTNSVSLSLTENGATVSATIQVACTSLPESLPPAWPSFWRGATLSLVLPVPLARFNGSGYPLSVDAVWAGDATEAVRALSPELPGNWSLSVRARVIADCGTYKLVSGDGSVASFDRMLGTDFYARRGGGTEVLSVLQTGYRIDDAEGTVLSFDASGRLVSSTRFGDGLRLLLSYTSGDKLSSLRYDGASAALSFSYGQAGYLSAASLTIGGNVRAQVLCGYDGQGRLSSLSYQEPGGTAVLLRSFAYTAAGALKKAVDERSATGIEFSHGTLSLDGLTAAYPRLLSAASGTYESGAFSAVTTVARESYSSSLGRASRLDLAVTTVSDAGDGSPLSDVLREAHFLRDDGTPAASYPKQNGYPRPPADEPGKPGTIASATELSDAFGGPVLGCFSPPVSVSFGDYPQEPVTPTGHCTFRVFGYVRLPSEQASAYVRVDVGGQCAYQPLDGSIPGVFQRFELGFEKVPSPSVSMTVIDASGADLPFHVAALKAYVGPVSGATLGGKSIPSARGSTVAGTYSPDWATASDLALSKRELAATLSRPRVFYSMGGRRKRFYPSSGPAPTLAFFGNLTASLSSSLAETAYQKTRDLTSWSPRTLTFSSTEEYAFGAAGTTVTSTRARYDEKYGETLAEEIGITTSYDAFGRVLSEERELPSATMLTRYRYDSMGNLEKAWREVEESDPTPHTVELVLLERAFDSDGRPTATTENGVAASFQYDAKARPWKSNPRSFASDGTASDDWPLTETTYDGASDPVRRDFCPASGNGMANVISYHRGRPISESVHNGPGLSVSWDEFPRSGQLCQTGANVQPVAGPTFAETKRLSFKKLHNVGCDFNDDFLGYENDAYGRLSRTRFDEEAYELWERTYRSDYAEEVIYAASNWLTSRVATQDQDTGAIVEITTHASTNYQDSFVTENVRPEGNGGFEAFGDYDENYDPLETLSGRYSAYDGQTVSAHGGSVLPTLSSFYFYDGFGRITGTDRWCDPSVNPLWSERFQYLARGDSATTLPTRVEMRFNGYSADYVETLTWDGRNRPVSDALMGFSLSYSYDGFGRLGGYRVQETGGSPGFDTGACSCAYDANGNLVSDGPGGSAVSFAYDAYGRLSSVSRPGQSVATFAYDEGGRRCRKTRGSETWDYIYMGWRLSGISKGASSNSFEYDEAGRIIRCGSLEYYYSSDGRLVASRSGSARMRFFYDARGAVGFRYSERSALTGFETNQVVCHYVRNVLGDVVGIVRVNADGSATRVATYAYDPWGLPVYEDEATFGEAPYLLYNPFRYRGYLYDRRTRLYLLGGRAYDPETRCFLTPDEFGYLRDDLPQGLLPYAYCLNNPVNYFDRSGHFPVLAAILIGLGATALVGGGLIAGGRLSGNEALTNIGDTIISVGETAAGIAMIATGVGGPLGMTLLGTGIGSFTNGLITMSNGGSYHAGWAGGQLSGALSYFSYFGAAIGAFAGSALTDLIDSHYDFNQIDLAKAGASAGIAFGLSWFGNAVPWGDIKFNKAAQFALSYDSALLGISNSIINVYWRGRQK